MWARAAACARAYDKYSAHVHLAAAGLGTVPTSLVNQAIFDAAGVFGPLEGGLGGSSDPRGRFVVKPAHGGSSIGVEVGSRRQVTGLLAQRAAQQPLVVQPFVVGQELTVAVLEGPRAAALPPVEVERRRATGRDILSYEDKYLANDDVRYYCPPRLKLPRRRSRRRAGGGRSSVQRAGLG